MRNYKLSTFQAVAHTQEQIEIIQGGPQKIGRCKKLHCPCNCSDSFFFPEIKLLFPGNEIQQQYFPSKIFSEGLKMGRERKGTKYYIVFALYLIHGDQLKIYDYIG